MPRFSLNWGIAHIPKERLLLYLIGLGVLPLLLVLFYNRAELSAVRDATRIVSRIYRTAMVRQSKQALNAHIREIYADADHFYVDHCLETQALCQQEVADLVQLMRDDPGLPHRELLKRVEFLEGGENRLQFATESVDQMAHMRESIETLVHPVEVHQPDLPWILAQIEGCTFGEIRPSPGSPQLLVSELQLRRKSTLGDNEVFLVNLKLIKREFQ